MKRRGTEVLGWALNHRSLTPALAYNRAIRERDIRGWETVSIAPRHTKQWRRREYDRVAQPRSQPQGIRILRVESKMDSGKLKSGEIGVWRQEDMWYALSKGGMDWEMRSK